MGAWRTRFVVPSRVAAVSSMLLLAAASVGITLYALVGQHSVEIPAVYSATFSQTESSVSVRPGLFGLFLLLTVLLALPVGLLLRAKDAGRAEEGSAGGRSPGQTAEPVEDEDHEDGATLIADWRPGGLTVAVWTVLTLPLGIVGMVLFALIYAAANGGDNRIGFDSGGLLLSLAVLVAVLVAHEFVHGIAMRWFGARPVYGAGVIKKVAPYLSCTAPGHRFTKRQFAVVGLAPAVVVSAAGAPWVAFGPYGGWMVVVMGAHLAGCIGDFWMVTLAALQSGRSEIEDTGAGMRVWEPAANDRTRRSETVGEQ